MQFRVITAFEEMFEGPLSLGLVGTAFQKNLLSIEFINPRKFSKGVHQAIDDRPFGGGDGMLMSVEPLKKCIEEIKSKNPQSRIVYLSPQGKNFTQDIAKRLHSLGDVSFLCGRYAGVDERLISSYVDEEISLGDYVLSGAELASMVVIDAISRLVSGVLGNEESFQKESFEGGLLEWPQFTRPREFEGMAVPSELLSGDHKKIDQWKRELSVLRTLDRRPELLKEAALSQKDRDSAKQRWLTMSAEQRKICGLGDLSKKIGDL